MAIDITKEFWKTIELDVLPQINKAFHTIPVACRECDINTAYDIFENCAAVLKKRIAEYIDAQAEIVGRKDEYKAAVERLRARLSNTDIKAPDKL